MKYGLYSIRDRLVGFMSPIVDQNDSTAMRNFMVAFEQKDTLMYARPEDFDLYKVGVFDSEDGFIILEGSYPEHICSGSSFVRKEVENGK